MKRALLLALPLLSGCGSLINVSSEDGHGSGVPPGVVYGGIRTDLAAASGFTDSFATFPVIAVVDVPFSAILDTVFLPFTAVRELFFPPDPVAPRSPGLLPDRGW